MNTRINIANGGEVNINGRVSHGAGQVTARQPTPHRFSKRGNGSNQTRMAFSVDNDLKPWLAAQPNKNRYINGIIRQHREMLCIQQEAAEQGKPVGELLYAMAEAYREKCQREAEEESCHRRPRKENPAQPLQD